jgi:hypothetical protein
MQINDSFIRDHPHPSNGTSWSLEEDSPVSYEDDDLLTFSKDEDPGYFRNTSLEQHIL